MSRLTTHSRWRLGALTVLVTLGLIYITGRLTGPLPAARWPSAGCLRILRMSSSVLSWADQHFSSVPQDSCHSGAMAIDQARSCLRRRAARLRRPARLVLVGDSRSRILQEQLTTFLRLQQGPAPEDVSAADVPPGPLRDYLLFATRDMCPIRGKFCSNILVNHLIQVEFWRRPFLYTLFVKKLWELVAECRARPPNCPDLVVLNGGMWYIRMEMKQQIAIDPSPIAWMLKLREHVSGIRTVLAELTKEVTVVWRLEESVMSDSLGLERKDMEYQKRMSVSHAFFYELQSQVDSLMVWSSMLPETASFAKRVCRPVRHLNGSTDAVVEDMFDQCEDEIHVGPQLRQRFISKLLDILCHVDGDSEAGHCCRGDNKLYIV